MLVHINMKLLKLLSAAQLMEITAGQLLGDLFILGVTVKFIFIEMSVLGEKRQLLNMEHKLIELKGTMMTQFV